ncbi:hypothetical protein K710_1261 [Streptococcus iniae SF1]|nr:hypothetical protein K710_1261 [Streptococcus iniae SF1]EKB52924.1 hypothetical protein A0G_0759 [Streptococcus iniae 9117]ESR09980.1 hypothetical protein IUSA1_04120 [Streptococcus iniae IUSA1]
MAYHKAHNNSKEKNKESDSAKVVSAISDYFSPVKETNQKLIANTYK